MDIVAFNAGLQGLRAVGEMLKAGYSVRNANEIAAATAEALSQLSTAWDSALTAQKEQAALTKRVGELEKEITELKDWNREKERYQLTAIVPNVFAYRLKPGMEQGEPPHSLCAKCYGDNKKSILQSEPPGQRFVTYFCPHYRTKLEMHMPRNRAAPPPDTIDDASIDEKGRQRY